MCYVLREAIHFAKKSDNRPAPIACPLVSLSGIFYSLSPQPNCFLTPELALLLRRSPTFQFTQSIRFLCCSSSSSLQYRGCEQSFTDDFIKTLFDQIYCPRNVVFSTAAAAVGDDDDGTNADAASSENGVNPCFITNQTIEYFARRKTIKLLIFPKELLFRLPDSPVPSITTECIVKNLVLRRKTSASVDISSSSTSASASTAPAALPPPPPPPPPSPDDDFLSSFADLLLSHLMDDPFTTYLYFKGGLINAVASLLGDKNLRNFVTAVKLLRVLYLLVNPSTTHEWYTCKFSPDIECVVQPIASLIDSMAKAHNDRIVTKSDHPCLVADSVGRWSISVQNNCVSVLQTLMNTAHHKCGNIEMASHVASASDGAVPKAIARALEGLLSPRRECWWYEVFDLRQLVEGYAVTLHLLLESMDYYDDVQKYDDEDNNPSHKQQQQQQQQLCRSILVDTGLLETFAPNLKKPSSLVFLPRDRYPHITQLRSRNVVRTSLTNIVAVMLEKHQLHAEIINADQNQQQRLQQQQQQQQEAAEGEESTPPTTILAAIAENVAADDDVSEETLRLLYIHETSVHALASSFGHVPHTLAHGRGGGSESSLSTTESERFEKERRWRLFDATTKHEWAEALVASGAVEAFVYFLTNIAKKVRLREEKLRRVAASSSVQTDRHKQNDDGKASVGSFSSVHSCYPVDVSLQERIEEHHHDDDRDDATERMLYGDGEEDNGASGSTNSGATKTTTMTAIDVHDDLLVSEIFQCLCFLLQDTDSREEVIKRLHHYHHHSADDDEKHDAGNTAVEQEDEEGEKEEEKQKQKSSPAVVETLRVLAPYSRYGVSYKRMVEKIASFVMTSTSENSQ